MSRRAQITLAASLLATTATIWFVHYQQDLEHETMYKGVVRDDERRKEKMKQRQAEFEESQRKRALYESVQKVEGVESERLPVPAEGSR